MEMKIVTKNKTKKEVMPLDQRISEILLTVGISANLQGYHYLKEAIKLAIKDPKCVNSVTKVLYPKVAEKFNTIPTRVERAIRHALDVSYNKGKIIKLNDVFGLRILDKNEKPTNSEFVALVADRLSLEYK